MSTETQDAPTNGRVEEGAETPVVAPQGPTIKLDAIVTETILVPIRGVTPLIPHRWSDKAKRMMRESQSGRKAKKAREPKVPEQEAEAATYRMADGRPGMPATAFKAAIADGARHFAGLTMTQAKQAFFVEGTGPEQLIAIEGEESMREDTPRNATGVADLRYRNQYDNWTTVLEITYVVNAIDQESLINLVNAAGLGGVGDWRPSSPRSKSGTFGRFEVDPDEPILRKA